MSELEDVSSFLRYDEELLSEVKYNRDGTLFYKTCFFFLSERVRRFSFFTKLSLQFLSREIVIYGSTNNFFLARDLYLSH